MAKKETTNDNQEISDDNYNEEGQDEASVLNSMDFNVDDEYKPDPLIPKGTYHGVVTNVSVKPTQYCIIWDICLHDNGGTMNDGESPIDGAHVWFRNWFPKPGDEDILTKSGKTNKRQSKINMLRDFSEGLGIVMSTPTQIVESIANAEWIGIEVDIDVDIGEWQGKFRNEVNRLKKSSMF